MPPARVPPLLVTSDTGISLIEVVVATALVASGVMLLVALFVQADAALAVARQRTLASVLARATVERLVAGIDAGTVDAAGRETLDPAGEPLSGAEGTFRREWSVTPLPAQPTLLRVEVIVTPAPGTRTAAATATLRTLRRQP
jgi:hypothetical protein